MTELTDVQRDRIAGVLVGQGCADALGVPYEFASAPVGEPAMIGGGLGPYEPAEWSDDTQMAVCIARVSATGVDLTSEAALDGIASAFVQWRHGGASDVGAQTASVIADAARLAGSPATRLRAASRGLHDAGMRTAGNGALMRTGVVAVARLDDRRHTADAATAVARLTHADPLAAESCVLWCEAIRVAVLEGRLEVRAGLDLIADDRRQAWVDWLDAADSADPNSFSRNGFTVVALQAAWSAIRVTSHALMPTDHIRAALTRAIRVGTDTDTVAAIAGQLLGARYGASAFPQEWRDVVHGWPGLRADDLARLALATAGDRPR